jgi:hypothetical protein
MVYVSHGIVWKVHCMAFVFGTRTWIRYTRDKYRSFDFCLRRVIDVHRRRMVLVWGWDGVGMMAWFKHRICV